MSIECILARWVAGEGVAFDVNAARRAMQPHLIEEGPWGDPHVAFDEEGAVGASVHGLDREEPGPIIIPRPPGVPEFYEMVMRVSRECGMQIFWPSDICAVTSEQQRLDLPEDFAGSAVLVGSAQELSWVFGGDSGTEERRAQQRRG